MNEKHFKISYEGKHWPQLFCEWKPSRRLRQTFQKQNSSGNFAKLYFFLIEKENSITVSPRDIDRKKSPRKYTTVLQK